MDNTDRRARKLNARRKAINLTRERHNVKANERIATLHKNDIFLDVNFEWTAPLSDPIQITSPTVVVTFEDDVYVTTDNGTQLPQFGVYGALKKDIEVVQIELSQQRRIFMLEETNYLR